MSLAELVELNVVELRISPRRISVELCDRRRLPSVVGDVVELVGDDWFGG